MNKLGRLWSTSSWDEHGLLHTSLMSDWGNLIVNVMKLTECCYAETLCLGLDAGHFESYLICVQWCIQLHLMNGSAAVIVVMSVAIVSLIRLMMTCDVARVWPTLYLHYWAHYQHSSHSQPNFRASINIWHGRHPWNICTNHLPFIIVFSCRSWIYEK